MSLSRKGRGETWLTYLPDFQPDGIIHIRACTLACSVGDQRFGLMALCIRDLAKRLRIEGVGDAKPVFIKTLSTRTLAGSRHGFQQDSLQAKNQQAGWAK